MKKLKFLWYVLVAANTMYKKSKGWNADRISGELTMHAVTTTPCTGGGSVTTLRQNQSVPINVKLREPDAVSPYYDSRAG